MDLGCRPRVFLGGSLCALHLWRYTLSLTSFLGSLMSTSEDKKPVSALEMVPMMSKITKDKLTSPNY